MKLFTKAITKQLQKQFPLGAEFENQKVVCKIFNPYGAGTWYLMNQDPNDENYLWGICVISDVEAGSVSKYELESWRLRQGMPLGLERDKWFDPMPAKEVWDKLQKGEHV